MMSFLGYLARRGFAVPETGISSATGLSHTFRDPETGGRYSRQFTAIHIVIGPNTICVKSWWM